MTLSPDQQRLAPSAVCPLCGRQLARRWLGYHLTNVHADVDEIAVERACWGDRRVALNRTEMLEAFRWLDGHGRSLKEIAAVLGVSDRSVQRWRRGAVPRSRAA